MTRLRFCEEGALSSQLTLEPDPEAVESMWAARAEGLLGLRAMASRLCSSNPHFARREHQGFRRAKASNSAPGSRVGLTLKRPPEKTSATGKESPRHRPGDATPLRLQSPVGVGAEGREGLSKLGWSLAWIRAPGS